MEKMLRITAFTAVLFCLMMPANIFAQQSIEQKAIQYVQNHAEEWDLSPLDVVNLRVTDIVPTKHNGVTHVYLTQQINGVDIDGATITTFITKEEKVGATAPRFVRDLVTRAPVTTAKLKASAGLESALTHLGYAPARRKATKILRSEAGNVHWFDGDGIASTDVRGQLKYIEVKGSYTLVWEYQIFSFIDGDLWAMYVSAEDGAFVKKENMTVHCQFEQGYLSHPNGHQVTCLEESFKAKKSSQNLAVGDGAQYNVVPLPFESPNHGARSLVVDPAHPTYSPYGWHSDDGDANPDYTFTRGNNVHAFADRDWNLTSDQNVDGGPALLFDFEADFSKEPIDYLDAAVTNLFYVNNMLHDLAYRYGFDEAGGNFQEFNPNNQGTGSDFVNALAQFGANDPNACGEDHLEMNDDGSFPDCINNANFATPSDGGNPRMRMFLWTSTAGNKFLRVDEPAEIAGLIETNNGDFGPALSEIPLTAQVALANPNLACGPLVSDLSNKIALIDRGSCDFSEKVWHAQNAGAVAAIICNFEEGLLPSGIMGAGEMASEVTIPSLFITRGDCERIRVAVSTGLTVSMLTPPSVSGPSQVDGDFDNGIILHEYTHGISNRLTGGPGSSGCLGSGESGSMGEGWSDFFALVSTVQPDDIGSKSRGIGTFAQRDEITGRGIRPFPYSSNMAVNPHTYDYIPFEAVPHGVGSVWCAMLWDMYWAFVDVYGFSEDVIDGDKGNNMAIQLIMDGMKMQPCRPGFVDARDAILLADQLKNGGANQDLIWSVFARRGLGYFADQGEVSSTTDGKSSFAVNPESVKELKVAKSVTPFINPGEDIEVTLTVTNHKGSDVTNVVITDALPQNGVAFKSNASPFTPTIENGQIIFEVGSMQDGATMDIAYTLSTNPAFASEQIFFDDMENGDDNWDFFFDEAGEINIWSIVDLLAFSGENAWFVENVDVESEHQLRNRETIEVLAGKPFIRFYHNYDTEERADAGLVSISTDGGQTWKILEEEFIRGGYTGRMQYGTFAIPNQNSFWGNSNGYVASYIDLRNYIGESVLIDFRFGTDDNTGGIGWFIDDFEYMDLLSYNGEVCITSDQGDSNCSVAPVEGTIVQSMLGGSVSVDQLTEEEVYVNVQPNPATNYLNVVLQSMEVQDAKLSMINATGQTVIDQKITLTGAKQMIPLEIRDLPKGMYFVHVFANNKQRSMKVILQ